MKKYKWLGPSGYNPTLGQVETGAIIEIKDDILAGMLLDQGKVKEDKCF